MDDERTWERGEFADFAQWFAQWLSDGRPCRCSVDRGESGLLTFDELQPARARVQSWRRGLKDSPVLRELFVD